MDRFIEFGTAQGYIIRLSQDKVIELSKKLLISGQMKNDRAKIIRACEEFATALYIHNSEKLSLVIGLEDNKDQWSIMCEMGVRQQGDFLDWDKIEKELYSERI